MVEEIIEQHAEEAAFLWVLRECAARDPHYSLKTLAELDERVEAHLDGLRIAEQKGWEVCCEALANTQEKGEIFTATALAVERGDVPGLGAILDFAGDTEELQQGMAAALGWLPFDVVKGVLPGLVNLSCPAPLQWLGISACVSHSQDPGPVLSYGLYNEDLRLQARALRAVGELGHVDLADEVEQKLDVEDVDCRFAAAWSLARFGRPSGHIALAELARSEQACASDACLLAVRCLQYGDGTSLIESLALDPQSQRTAVIATGALGSVARVPWLLSFMRDDEWARAAGEALTMITGVDLDSEGLALGPMSSTSGGPTDEIEGLEVSMDPDENLPWPDVDKVKRWWRDNSKRFTKQRHLLGRPIEGEWLSQVLRQGYQRQRAAAALELALVSSRTPQFNVMAPAYRQRVLLGC